MAQYSVRSPLAFRNLTEEGKVDVRVIINNHFYKCECLHEIHLKPQICEAGFFHLRQINGLCWR